MPVQQRNALLLAEAHDKVVEIIYLPQLFIWRRNVLERIKHHGKGVPARVPRGEQRGANQYRGNNYFAFYRADEAVFLQAVLF